MHHEAIYEIRVTKRGLEGVLLYRDRVVAKLPVRRHTSIQYEVKRAFDLAELLGYYLVLFVVPDSVFDCSELDWLSSVGVDVVFWR